MNTDLKESILPGMGLESAELVVGDASIQIFSLCVGDNNVEIPLLGSALTLSNKSLVVADYEFGDHGLIFINGVRANLVNSKVKFPLQLSFRQNPQDTDSVPESMFVLFIGGRVIVIRSEDFLKMSQNIILLLTANPDKAKFLSLIFSQCMEASLVANWDSTWGEYGVQRRRASEATTETAKNFEPHMMRETDTVNLKITEDQNIVIYKGFASELKDRGITDNFDFHHVIILLQGFETVDRPIPLHLSVDGTVKLGERKKGAMGNLLFPQVTINEVPEYSMKVGETAKMMVVGDKASHFLIKFLGNGDYEITYEKKAAEA